MSVYNMVARILGFDIKGMTLLLVSFFILSTIGLSANNRVGGYSWHSVLVDLEQSNSFDLVFNAPPCTFSITSCYLSSTPCYGEREQVFISASNTVASWTITGGTNIGSVNNANHTARFYGNATVTVVATDVSGCTASRTQSLSGRSRFTTIGVSPLVYQSGDDYYASANQSVSIELIPGAFMSETIPTMYQPLVKDSYSALNNTRTFMVDSAIQSYTSTPASMKFISYNIVTGCRDTTIVNLYRADNPSITSVTTQHVSCYGGSNGAATVVASSLATQPVIAYSWSDGTTSTSGVKSNLTSGVYGVTVSTAYNTSASQSFTITQPSAPLSATVTKVSDSSCPNFNNGEAGVAVSGGTTPYAYLWSTGSTTATATNLVGGTNTVTITDSNGCGVAASVTLVNVPLLTVDIVEALVACYNGTDGSLSGSLSGASGSVDWLWTTGATSSSITNLGSGTYGVTASYSVSGNVCKVTNSRVLSNPLAITVSLTGQNPSCSTGATGSVSSVVTGTQGTFAYLWSTSQTTSSVTGLTAGTYKLTVTDSKGCTGSNSVTLTAPSALGLTMTEYASTYCTVSVTLGTSLSNTTGSLSYLWSSGATTPAITAFAGTSSVTVTDGLGCTASGSKLVVRGTAPILSTSTSVISCSGATGSATVSVTNGTAASYLWSNGSTAATATGLNANTTYSVTAVDIQGCLSEINVSLSQPSALSSTITPVAESCYNYANGSASIQVSGGLQPASYSYLWSTGQTGSSVSGLAAGSNSVTITSSYGCTAVASTTVPLGPTSSVSIASTTNNVICGSGSIVLKATPSSASTFEWELPNGTITSTGSNTSLTVSSGGLYKVVATNGLGCTSTASYSVTQPGTFSITNCWLASYPCYSERVAVEILATNPVASWTITAGTNIGSIDNINHTARFYGNATATILATDVNGCTTSLAQSFNGRSRFTTYSVSPTYQSGSNFYASPNQPVTITFLPGASMTEVIPAIYQPLVNETYTPSSNTRNFLVDSAILNYANGPNPMYFFTYNSTTNCYDTTTVNLYRSINPIITTINVKNVSCYGGSDGSATVVTSPSPIQQVAVFMWSNGTTSSSATKNGLSAGIYSVTLSTGYSTSVTQSFTITQPSGPLSATITKTSEPTCPDFNNGQAIVAVAGGTTPYAYLWSTGSTSATPTNLVGGTNTVTITDANGCKHTTTISLVNMPLLALNLTETPISCFNGSNGALSGSLTGASGTVSWSWTTGSTSSSLSNLSSGAYGVTASYTVLGNVCMVTNSRVLSNPSPINVSLIEQDPSCVTGATGVVSSVVTGAQGVYTYLWSTAKTTSSITGLLSGSYSLTVTDSKGCTGYNTAILVSPSQLTLILQPTNETCNGQQNGSIIATPSGGTGAYSAYLWSNSKTVTTITGLAAGSYSLTVTDSKGCTVSESATLISVPKPNVSIVNSGLACADGSKSVVLTSSPASFSSYSWSTGGTTSFVSVTTTGLRTLTVTDVNGCTNTASITLGSVPSFSVSMTATNAKCTDYANGTASAAPTGSTNSPWTYKWSTGFVTSTITGLTAGVYTATVTDNQGCTASNSVTVSNPSTSLGLTLTESSLSYCTPSVTLGVTPSNTTGSLTYLWSNGATTSSTTALAGLSFVTVTDALGCTVSANKQVIRGSAPILQVTTTAIPCFGSTGSATVSVLNGTATSYLWNYGQTTVTATGLSANIIYIVTVTDVQGCASIANVSLTQPSLLSITVTPTNESCFGYGNGAAGVVVSGGIQPANYSYSWSNSKTTSFVSSLSSGVYFVTATSNYGCSVVGFTTVPSGLTTTVSIASTTSNLICGSNSIVLKATTLANSTFEWEQPNGLVISTGSNSTFSATTGGLYKVVATSPSGCTSTASFSVIQSPSYSVSVVNTDILCNGGTSNVSLALSGGTPPYQYKWSNGITNSVLNNVISGSYVCTITDFYGCTTTTSKSISQPVLLTTQAAVLQNPICSSSTVNLFASSAGGTGSVSYAWKSGSTVLGSSLLLVQQPLSNQTYTLVATDANGCTASDSKVVTVTSVSATNTWTYISCGGNQPRATVMLTPTSNATTPVYSYAWSDGGTVQNPTSLTAGTYIVTVTETSSGCKTTNNVFVSPLTALSSQVLSTTNNSCNGNTLGAITTSTSNGLSPYSYVWSSGQTTSNLTGLTSGSYTMTATDKIGCTSTVSATITTPTLLQTSILTSKTSICLGESVNFSNNPVGGTSAYSYSWKVNGAVVSTFANFTHSPTVTSSYNLLVTDANGCTTSQSVTITVNTIGASNTWAYTSCGGNQPRATVTLTPTSNATTPVYSYAWSDGGTVQNPTSLTTGTYIVTVTETSSGCKTTNNVFVTPLTALSSQVLSTTNNSCNGNTLGAITTSTSNGLSPYSYAWSSGQTTSNLTGLTSGGYTMTATDKIGCTSTVSATITTPTLLQTSILTSKTSICLGESVNFSNNPVGGTSAYSYSWKVNGALVSTFANFTHSPTVTSSYNLLVTDANGCTTSQTVTITVNTIGASNTWAYTSCGGNQPRATVTLTPTSNATTPVYSYAWSDGGTVQNPTSLTAGTYIVTVTETSSGCKTTNNVFVTPLTALSSQVLSTTNNSCNSNTLGAITTSTTNGLSPYSYAWSSGQTTSNLTGLTSGGYTMTATDKIGCTSTVSATITTPTLLQTSILTSKTSICLGESVNFSNNPVGGTSAYSYSWTVNGALVSTFANFTHSPTVTSSYNLLVTDANGCTTSQAVIVTVNTIGASNTWAYTSCGGNQPRATVTLTPTSNTSTPVYSYTWSDGGTVQNPTSLTAGTYIVTVTETSSGCKTTNNVFVTPLTALSASLLTTVPVNCNSTNSGSIDIQTTGGQGVYVYIWSNSKTTEDITNLAVGTYLVSVTDQIGCTAMLSAYVDQPTAMSAVINQISVLGCGTGYASQLDVTQTGGTAPYTYAWSNAQTSKIATVYSSDLYKVTITDFNGCVVSSNISVTANPALDIELTATDETCFNYKNGILSSQITGGVQNTNIPYAYTWSNGLQVPSMSGLEPNTYTLTVTQGANCSANLAATVSAATSFTVAISPSTYNLCRGASVVLVGSNSTGQYKWTSDVNTQVVNTSSNQLSVNVPAIYTATYTSSLGCTATAVATVTDVAPSISTPLVKNTSCGQLADGFIASNVVGAAPLNYLWSNTKTTANISGLAAGVYNLTVVNAAGCANTFAYTITDNPAVTLTLTSTDITCFGANDGLVNASVSGGSGTYFYNWSDASSTANLSALSANSYTLTITDANGCSATASKTILEPSRLGVTLTANTDVCLGSSAFVNAAVSGGVGGNAFNWVANNVGLATTNNFVSQNISLNTKFKVTVTNTNGCKATDSIQTYLIEFASAPITQYNSCQGQTYGSINPNITVSNASTRLRYTWSNGMTTSVLTSVPTGTYGLVVLDSLTGCSANFSINLPATSPLQALSGIVKNINCFGGSDGKLSVIAGGGLSPYSYTWSTGATADSIVNLRKGNYSVTVIDAVGCKAISYFSIIEPSPVNTYANSIITSGCLGYSQGQVALSTTGGTAPYAYVWDNGSTSNTVSALPEGIINVTVSDAYGCSAALAVNVPRLPMPLVQASSAYNYVCSNSVVDVIANASGGTLPYAFRWNTANTAQNIRAFISTDSLFKVTLTDANGCTSTSSYRIGLYNTEPAVAGPDINLCTGVLLNLTTPVNQNIVSFNWVTPVGSVIAGRSINVQNPVVGEYILNTRDINGCTDADTMRFTMTNVPTMVDVQAQNSICYNSTLQLSATAYPALNYVWFTPNANGGRTTVNTANQAFLDYPNIKVSGFYGVQLDLGACGVLTDSVFVRVNRLTPPTITGSASACSRDTLILRASGPNGFYTWTFPDNSTNIGSGFMLPNLKQSDQGLYRVFYSSAVGSLTCQSDTARITVTISPALDTTGVAARMVSLVCSGDPLSLTATPPPNGSGNYAYHWIFPSGNEAFTRTTTINNPIDGRYYLYVKDLTTGCKVPVYPVSVSIAPRISVVPLSTTTPNVCSGDSIFLTALKIPGVQYVWTMPNGTKDTTLSSKYTINPASPANSGTYKVFVQAGTCLSNESEVIARVNPLPNIKISKDTMIGEVGIPMTIFATGGFQYLWTPRTYLSNADVAGPRIIPEVVDSLWYYVKGFDQNRCYSYDSVYVVFRAPPPGRANLVINDILTPNNDGVNDTWNIKNIENLLDYTLRIYDRRGLIIYETDRYDNSKGWDATFEGNPLPEGTYWYIIHTPAKDFKGPISILR